MKAVIICRDYPPAVSGLGDYTFFTAREMAARGVEVTVITSEREVNDDQDGFLVRPVVPCWDRRRIGCILAEVQRAAPDVVLLQYVPHMYGRSGVALWVLELAARLKKVAAKLVVVFHELYYPWTFSKRLPIGLLHRFQVARLISIADASVITTRERLETMRRWLPRLARKMVEIPVGSNIPVVDVGSDSTPPGIIPGGIGSRIEGNRGQYASPGAPLVGGFGRLSLDERNFVLLLQALALARQAHPGLRFLWIGDLDYNGHAYRVVGANAERLGLGDALRWTGPLAPESVSEHLSALDAFLSTQDGGPCFRRGSLVAAMAHGLPIIALEGKATDARLQNGKDMIVVPRSAESVAAAIGDVLLSPDRRRDLGARAREFHDAYLGWGVITEQLLACATENERVLAR